MKVLELFAGIGAPRQALYNLGIKAEFTPIEFDKKVINAYNLLYGTDHKPIDITTWEPTQEYDMVIGGFPCQPFSNAGKKLGFDDPRGKLFRDTLEIIRKTKPDNVILENVKGILQEKNKWIIDEIKTTLENWGFDVKVQVINAKHFIPQNRERVFIIATKEHRMVEIDLPERTTILKDYLDKEVDPSFYYDMEKIIKIKNWNSQERPLKKVAHTDTITTKTITTRTQPGTASQQLIIENIKSGKNTIDLETFINLFQGETIFSDGTTRQNGYREKQKNWLIPLTKNYTSNIINDPRGELNTLTTNPRKIIENGKEIEKWFLKNRINVKGLFYETFNQENYLTGGLSDGVGTITATGANSRQKIFESLTPLRIRSLRERERVEG